MLKQGITVHMVGPLNVLIRPGRCRSGREPLATFLPGASGLARIAPLQTL